MRFFSKANIFLIKNKENIVNLFSLAAIQGSGAIFPLLVFPYLALILGVDKYALIVVSEVLALYVLTISLYSFEITGVSTVSKLKLVNSNKVLSVVLNILITRLLIFVFCSTVVLAAAYFFWNDMLGLVLVWLLFPLGMILQSNYYFQAIEKNLVFSAIILFSRLLSFILVIFFVTADSNLALSSFFITGSYFISGILSFIYLVFKEKDSTKFRITYRGILEVIKEDKAIFFSNVSIILFRNSNVIILKILTTDSAVTIYSLAEKIIKTLQALARPLNQFYFAKVSNKIILVKDKNSAMLYNRNIIWQVCKPQLLLIGSVIITVVLIGSISLYFFDVIPEYVNNIKDILLLMCIATFLGVANFMFGSVGLNLSGLSAYLAKSMLITGLSTVFISILLCYKFEAWGAAISYVFGELLLLIFILHIYNREIRNEGI